MTMEDWRVAQEQREGSGDEPHVDEDAILGRGDDYAGQDGADGEAPANDDSEQEARKAKMAKQMRMIYIGAAIAGLLIVGMVILRFVGARNAQADAEAQQAQQAQVQQVVPQQGSQELIAPVVAQPGAAPVPVGAEHVQAESSAAAPGAAPAVPAANFGLQQVPAQPAEPGSVAQGPTPQAPAAPVPTSARQLAAAPVAPVTGGMDQVPSAELEKLRSEMAALRSEVAEKQGTIDSLRNQVEGLKSHVDTIKSRPRAAAAVIAEQKPAKQARKQQLITEKAEAPKAGAPDSTIRETVTPLAQAPSAGAPPAATTQAAKSKARPDYRIYAVSDGRVWIKGPDGEPMQIGARSPLPDGSRVTSIDADKAVVFTTSGEIR